MRNKIKLGIFGLALAGLIGSCQSSNDVVSNRNIQKRKYNDGYYISFNKKNNKRVKEDDKVKNLPADDQIADIIEPAAIDPQVETVNPDTKKYIESIEVEEVGYGDFETIQPEGSYEPTAEPDHARISHFLQQRGNGPVNFIKKRKATIKTVLNNKAASNSGAMLIVLVILALLIPPLAVIIFEGATSRFWIDLLLAILGWGAWGLFGGIFWLCGLAAVIFALLIVLEVI